MQLHLSFLLFLLLLTLNSSKAQPLNTTNSTNTTNNDNNGLSSPNFNPSMAIVIVVLISAFFFLGFFSIYIRQCTNEDSPSVRLNSFITRSRRNLQRGLPQDTINTFPTFAYSQVKAHKIGKGSLECAVCLNEFEDDETLRLLPRCNHVFHPDCIDAWFAMHVTCPVCRADLSLATDESLEAALEAPSNSTPVEAVVIDVERDELDKTGLEKTAVAKVLRSHSTGHSVAQEGVDRFTLRLPEHIRREIMAARKFQRSASCVAFPTGEDGSMRRGLRWFGGGEGSSRGARSVRLGRSDRWPSFFARTFSAKFSVKRGKVDGEGSMRRGEAEGSASGKFAAVIAPFDCLGVGGGGAGVKGEVAGQVNA